MRSINSPKPIRRPLSQIHVIHQGCKFYFMPILLCDVFFLQSLIYDPPLNLFLLTQFRLMNLIHQTRILFSSKQILQLRLKLLFLLLNLRQIIFKNLDNPRMLKHSSPFRILHHRSIRRFLHTSSLIRHIIHRLPFQLLLLVIPGELIDIFMVHWIMQFPDLF